MACSWLQPEQDFHNMQLLVHSPEKCCWHPHGEQNRGFAVTSWKEPYSRHYENSQYPSRGVAETHPAPIAKARCKMQPVDFCDTSRAAVVVLKKHTKSSFSRHEEKHKILIPMLGESDASKKHVKRQESQSTAELPPE